MILLRNNNKIQKNLKKNSYKKKIYMYKKAEKRNKNVS